MINAGIVAVALIAILWQLSRIKHLLDINDMKEEGRLGQINLTLAALNASVEALSENKDKAEENTINALNQICQALNAYFTTAGSYMNNSGFALQNIAVCMIPFMDSIKEKALEDEDYEKAQECIKVINNLKEIIK